MWYEYRCPCCEEVFESQLFAGIGEALRGLDGEWRRCGECDALVIRIVSVPQVRPTAEPYYNHSVNAWVKDDKHYQQVLKEKARVNSQITGTDHNYQPVYPGDLKDPGTMKKLGVGLDGGESIEHSRRHNPGAWKPSTRKVIT